MLRTMMGRIYSPTGCVPRFLVTEFQNCKLMSGFSSHLFLPLALWLVGCVSGRIQYWNQSVLHHKLGITFAAVETIFDRSNPSNTFQKHCMENSLNILEQIALALAKISFVMIYSSTDFNAYWHIC